ncbi:MAG: class I SAM-dependent methyltransferase [Patescibacteria group bacterium]
MNTKNPYQQYYSKSYIDDSTARINKEWVKIVKSKLAISFYPGKKVLDVACGISTLGKTFGNNVYGFDMNPEAVKVAQKNGVKARLGDVEKKWEYPDGYFDIVVASHIIEHVVSPDYLILEAKRVLKKNGLFIVATPNLAAWFNRILLLVGFQPFFTEVSTVDKTLGLKFTRKFTSLRSPLGHLRIFTHGSLKDLLGLYGFKIIKTAGAEFLAFPPLLLFIDRVFSQIVSLASNIIIVGKKL